MICDKDVFWKKDHWVIENAQNEIMQMFLLSHFQIVQAVLIHMQGQAVPVSFLFFCFKWAEIH